MPTVAELSGSNLIQCNEGHGWLSPRAAICPTCGVAHEQRPRSDGTKANRIGWAMVKGFWAIVLLLVIVLAAI